MIVLSYSPRDSLSYLRDTPRIYFLKKALKALKLCVALCLLCVSLCYSSNKKAPLQRGQSFTSHFFDEEHR